MPVPASVSVSVSERIIVIAGRHPVTGTETGTETDAGAEADVAVAGTVVP